MKTNNKLLIFFSIFFVANLFGGLVGLLVIEKKQTIIRKELPSKIVQDLTVTQLYANISGTIEERGSNYIVVNNMENTIKAYYDPNGISDFTNFETKEKIAFDELRKNDIVVDGGISIYISSTIQNQPTGQITAHNWQIKKSNE